ncbi:helix-turn-helix transcriptional regulator [Olsenella sp. DSM 107455]|uniref:Helix-turn-helix transcriptional regulator n=1 Tax=Thermophilibacter gallinarum TaxID=2779357 RepID=A0ABR9QSB6_9ACTN|nr:MULTISPECIES: helix-turn-helix transcriptional regulator [Atopobiaceae]MBE5023970.1 helix-turn-helix transcriptional regulator [Thermophilibacter gallinarum]OUO60399.1 hypothetical protein B5F73_03680 [Olsenella sp. An270]
MATLDRGYSTLQALRKKAGFRSATAFAEKIGMNAYTYTNYEQGKANFTLEKAWEFADLLGCSLDELAGRQWPPEGASAPADPMREELVRCYDASTAENRHSLVVAARNAALASGEAAERGADTEAV